LRSRLGHGSTSRLCRTFGAGPKAVWSRLAACA
jgi:hypothetical protein